MFEDKLSIKYDDNVPKGYDVSKIQYTFDFIYLVLRRDATIDVAISEVSDKYGISQEYLKDYLIENKYILDKTKKHEFKKQLKQYSTKTLKRILKKHGLRKSGKRETIENRIFESSLLRNNYQLSSKSKVFFKNKKRRIRIYNEYLSEYYYFNEFNEYYMDNFRKKEAKIPVEYIKVHINKAYDDENHKKYTYNTQVMIEHYHQTEKYRKMLEYVLRMYCMNINPIWKIDSLKEHGGFHISVYNNLIMLQGRLGKNSIISNYYLIWDSFNFDRIIVPKYEGYRILKDILHQKNYQNIISDLNERFYDNEDLKIKKITQKTLFDF